MNNKKYNAITDFLKDDSFISWVKKTKLSDQSFWDFWIQNNPDKKQLVNEAKALVLGIQFDHKKVPEDKINAAWDKFASTVKEKHPIENNPIPKKKSANFKWLSIAASIVFLLSLTVYSLTKTTIITHTTNYGETLNLKLQDGSSVILNSNSSISFPENNSRKVTLKGEAYFQVDKKEETNAKFWVITNDLQVEVYGTAFNVNTKKQKTQVYLEEGNIWLSLKNGESKKMKPGHLISYSAKQDKILAEKQNIKADEQVSWRNGVLIFNNLSLEDAMKKVTETYGYKVIFKDKESKNSLITGTVPTTNIDICLQAIKKSVNVNITKENSNLVVTKK